MERGRSYEEAKKEEEEEEGTRMSKEELPLKQISMLLLLAELYGLFT